MPRSSHAAMRQDKQSRSRREPTVVRPQVQPTTLRGLSSPGSTILGQTALGKSTLGPTTPLRRVAEQIVSDAILASEAAPSLPGLGGYGRLRSILRSVETRTGQIMPDVIAAALRRDPRLDVRLEVTLPVARPDGSHRADLPKRLRVDVIVIERDLRHATLIDVKIGSANLGATVRNKLCRRLDACASTAHAHLTTKACAIKTTSWGILDVHGCAGFDCERAIMLDAADRFFGVPVKATITGFLDHVGLALDRRLPPFIRDLLPDVLSEPDIEPEDGEQNPNSLLPILPDRLVGPAERRALAIGEVQAAAFGRAF